MTPDPAADLFAARVSDGSDEAARWVADALASARDWFPETSEQELRAPLEQAFELASRTGRGEREFHAVFEAELRRAIEELAVVGSTGSVLPGQSQTAPQPFQTVAAGVDETPDREPASEDRADGDTDDDRARAFGLAVGALRFHDGLSAKEIEDEHEIEADYYSQIMQWLLGDVDRGLGGEYPAHLDRDRMAGFAAGLEGIHASFEVDRHVRECPGCATYLADLLEATVRAVEPGSLDPVVNGGAGGVTRRRRRRRAPVMSVKAAELRVHARKVTPPSPDPSADYVETRAPQRARVRGRRDTARRRAAGIFAGVAVAAVVAIAAISSGSDDQAPEPTVATQRDRPGDAGSAGPSKTDEERALRVKRERAQRRAARARREARELRAARRRRRAQPATPSPPPPAPMKPPAGSPPPAASSPPAAPAPSPPQPPPSGEFGLEP